MDKLSCAGSAVDGGLPVRLAGVAAGPAVSVRAGGPAQHDQADQYICGAPW